MLIDSWHKKKLALKHSNDLEKLKHCQAVTSSETDLWSETDAAVHQFLSKTFTIVLICWINYQFDSRGSRCLHLKKRRKEFYHWTRVTPCHIRSKHGNEVKQHEICREPLFISVFHHLRHWYTHFPINSEFKQKYTDYSIQTTNIFFTFSDEIIKNSLQSVHWLSSAYDKIVLLIFKKISKHEEILVNFKLPCWSFSEPIYILINLFFYLFIFKPFA